MVSAVGSVSLCAGKLHRGAAAGTIIAPEEKQVQGCGEIVAENGQVVRCAIAIIMAEAENSHVADRAGGTASYAYIDQTRYTKDNTCQHRQGNLGQIIRGHQNREYNNAGNGNNQEKSEKRGHESSEWMRTPNRTMHDDIEPFLSLLCFWGA